jgi:hypothetical protein
MAESSTCPGACPHKGAGCYARYHNVGRLWKKLDEGRIGMGWDAFIAGVKALADGTLWRYGVAGDLPGKGNRINRSKLDQLIEANRGKNGFSYTHKPMTKANRFHVEHANHSGLTINLSADNLAEAQELLDMRVGPVVLSMPEDPRDWPKATADGTKVVPCLAVTHVGRNCLSCQWCAKVNRKFVVGFPAHGTGKRKVEEVYKEGVDFGSVGT